MQIITLKRNINMLKSRFKLEIAMECIEHENVNWTDNINLSSISTKSDKTKMEINKLQFKLDTLNKKYFN